MNKNFNNQLALPLEFVKLKNKDNFLINDNNKLALSLVYELKNTNLYKKKYSYPILYIYGPKGSGKTHLGYIFKEIQNAEFISEISKTHLSMIKGGHSFIIDNLEPKTNFNQKALLHFFNESYYGNGSILILSKIPPSAANYGLNDLNSRIKSFMNTEILLPSDEVLYSILIKELNDRKLILKDNLCFYIIRRIKRNYISILKVVEALDRISLENKTKLKLVHIKEVIQTLGK